MSEIIFNNDHPFPVFWKSLSKEEKESLAVKVGSTIHTLRQLATCEERKPSFKRAKEIVKHTPLNITDFYSF